MADRALVYTTSTGDKPAWTAVAPVIADEFEDPFGSYCFVCARCTDHFGEHDDLVAQGLAFYGPDRTVFTKAQWDAWANPALASR